VVAYDVRGNLIPPNQYRSKIAGAEAAITFALTHYYIREADAFTADLVSLTVLKAPPALPPITPTKKRPAKKDPILGDISPSPGKKTKST
jgi:hypothetical protein